MFFFSFFLSFPLGVWVREGGRGAPVIPSRQFFGVLDLNDAFKKLTPSYALELCVLSRCGAVATGCDTDFERRCWHSGESFCQKRGRGEAEGKVEFFFHST